METGEVGRDGKWQSTETPILGSNVCIFTKYNVGPQKDFKQGDKVIGSAFQKDNYSVMEKINGKEKDFVRIFENMEDLNTGTRELTENQLER